MRINQRLEENILLFQVIHNDHSVHSDTHIFFEDSVPLAEKLCGFQPVFRGYINRRDILHAEADKLQCLLSARRA